MFMLGTQKEARMPVPHPRFALVSAIWPKTKGPRLSPEPLTQPAAINQSQNYGTRVMLLLGWVAWTTPGLACEKPNARTGSTPAVPSELSGFHVARYVQVRIVPASVTSPSWTQPPGTCTQSPTGMPG